MPEPITILGHFKRLFDFSGREDRASFWPYIGVAFAIVMTFSMTILLPMIMQSMQEMQQFAAQNPGQATVRSGPGHYSISVRGEHPEFISPGSIALYLVVTFGLAVLLFAAAIVRRLRDTGRSGAWSLLPLPFILYSSALMPQIFAGGSARAEGFTGLFLSVFISNFLYIAALSLLVVLLAQPTKPSDVF